LGRVFIEAGQSQPEKIFSMWDDFFNPQAKRLLSLRECYITMTGDKNATGRLSDCDARLIREMREAADFREAMMDSATFAFVLGGAMNRALAREYTRADEFSAWTDLADVETVRDFRQKHITRYGGFGDMPEVAEAAPYTDIASLTDEEAVYAPTKRGGTFALTWEMLKNDDARMVRRLPIQAGYAARRTLYKFVLDFLRTNAVIYDGKALFHADHGNLGTAAFSATEFTARRLAMMAQTELDSGAPLGIQPAFIWISPEQEEAVFNSFIRDTNQDPQFIQTKRPAIRTVNYWTGENWFLSANKAQAPMIEIAFLDGQQEPELFTQDNPSAGSFFTNDTITWKIRHVYGGAVTDYRGLDGSIVV
jgi:hypothetical protein